MSLKQRLEKLEEARPEKGSGLRLICKSIVRRDGDGLLWEKPFICTLLRHAPDAPATLQRHDLRRHDTEGQAAFTERVREAIRQIDPAEAESFRWDFDPKTHHTE